MKHRKFKFKRIYSISPFLIGRAKRGKRGSLQLSRVYVSTSSGICISTSSRYIYVKLNLFSCSTIQYIITSDVQTHEKRAILLLHPLLTMCNWSIKSSTLLSEEESIIQNKISAATRSIDHVQLMLPMLLLLRKKLSYRRGSGYMVSLVVLERQNCSFSGEVLLLTMMYYNFVKRFLWIDKPGKVSVCQLNM
ncbi:hypothetical protein MTR67_026528 [Solanum verrucosum]|uniref:Uncharacterized protein n=1 Tax=Solanum verrucosum TaxID=315347 RepID=A0AAF0TZT1_SOLVR|nr:hypothetical protein MTR67_026528 [Solanum verrucosum]